MRRSLFLFLVISATGAAVVAAVAFAKSNTLRIAHNGRVTNQQRMTVAEPIVVTGRGSPVYTLTGDSVHHPLCNKANGCFSFWPPVTVASAHKLSAAPGIRGRLGTWRRDGFLQVTLAGHPLYTYALDKHRDSATGEGVRGFGGTWHVLRPSAGTMRSTGTTTSTSTMPSTTTSTTTSTSIPY